MGGIFHRNSGLIRSTLKYEKEKENINSFISIGSDMKGNINTGKIGGDMHQEYTETINIDTQKEAELKSYGVYQSQIDELKSIISTPQKDKNTFTSKVMKWLGSVTASVAAHGLNNNIPAITDFVGRLIH